MTNLMLGLKCLQTLAAFPLSGQCFQRAGGANSFEPVAPSTKSRCVSTIGPNAPQRFTKTCSLHASLEQRQATPSFHQQEVIRNKSLEI